MNPLYSTPILVVEDSPEDYETVLRAFRKVGMGNPVYHCEDGDEALDYLFQRGAYTNASDAPRPGLVLLDLNLPGTDGREVLRAIKTTDGMRRIPVIVLTTSSDERDIVSCYDAGANSYIQKPVNFSGFMDAIQGLKEYWFQIVLLPRKGAAS